MQLIQKAVDSPIIRQNNTFFNSITVFLHTFYGENVNTHNVNQKTSFYFLLSKHSKYCSYLWRDLEFKILGCEQYALGSVLQVIGSSNYVTASGNNSKNKLLIQSIEPIGGCNNSAIPLFSQVLIFSATFLQFLYKIKLFLASSVEFYFSSSTQQLIMAMVLGDKSLLETDMRHLFKITGTLHVLAVSGMHVNLLYVLLQTVLSRFHRHLRFFSQVLVLVSYTIMVGMSASVVRASSMLLYRLIGTDIFGKQIQTNNSLQFVVLGMLLCNAWFLSQVGFQLSVGATATILFFLNFKKAISGVSREKDVSWAFLIGSVGSIQASVDSDDGNEKVSFGDTGSGGILYDVRLYLEWIKGYLKETASLGLVIQVFLAPLLWWHFGEVSWVGVLAGPATLWLVPPIYLLSLIYFIIYSLLEILTWISTTLLSISSIFLPLIFPIKIAEIFLKISLILLRTSIEVVSHLFLFILTQLTNLTQEIALIQWQNFSLAIALAWYSVVLALFFVYWKYKKTTQK